MPRRSGLGRPRTVVDLIWPLAGVDRRVSYQNQPPWTTPVGINVRVDGTAEYRQRGGSRPGLSRPIHTELPGSLQLLTKVAELRSRTPADVVSASGAQLIGYPAPWWSANPATPVIDRLARVIGVTGIDTALSVFEETTLRVDVLKPTEVSVYVSPCTPDVPYSGSVEISIGTVYGADPRQDGYICQLNLSNGEHWLVIQQYESGILKNETTGPVSLELADVPGLFTVRFSPSSEIRAWFRGRELAAMVTEAAYGRAANARVVSANSSICISQLTYNFSLLGDADRCWSTTRKDSLVAIADRRLFFESSNAILTEVPSAIEFGNCPRFSADDREQKLYIADYGVAYSQADVSFSAPFSTITLATDVEALGINTSHRMELSSSSYGLSSVQLVAVAANVDGGSFRLRFGTSYTADIPYNASAATIEASLEAIAAIDDVTVTGTAPNWTVTFEGSLANTSVPPLFMDIEKLTASTGSPTGGVTILTVGRGDESILGSYEITGVSGNDVTFSPAITAATSFTGTVRFGVPPKVFDPQTKTISIHAATPGKGFVPSGARVVAIYRDRVVYAGADDEPGVWWASRQNDPNDWDISENDAGAAVGASNAPAGKLSDPITALIPHGDQCLVFGCRSSLWIMRGDPGYGGQVDQLSRKIGIVDFNAWTRTPDDMVVFLSTDGLYVIPAGCHGSPTSLSRERLPQELIGVSPDAYAVSLEWDTEARGIHIFVTRTDVGVKNTHWFLDWETKSFWQVELQASHEPMVTFERSVFGTGFNQVLLGSRDGRIRMFDRFVEIDDDVPFESQVYLGPMEIATSDTESVVAEITSELTSGSGPIKWELKPGQTASQAMSSPAQASGTWSESFLQYMSYPRVRASNLVVKLSNGATGRRWMFERLQLFIKNSGFRRRR